MIYRVFIFQFNRSQYLDTQIKLIKKFSLNPCEIVVIDNSTELYHKEQNKEVCESNGVVYNTGIEFNTDPSTHHAKTIHYALQSYPDTVNYLLLDHDAFPVNYYSFHNLLQGKTYGGVYQIKNNNDIYLHPNCFTSVNPDINMMPGKGTDTGGGMVGRITEENTVFYKYEIAQIIGLKIHEEYAIYEIFAGVFFHFKNGSAWNNVEGIEERNELLLNRVKMYL